MTYKFSESLKKIFTKYNKKNFLNIKGKYYTFGHLDRMSNQICNCLLEKKIYPKNKIIIAAKKDIIIFASIFACLKIGCAYSIVILKCLKKDYKKYLKDVTPT